MGSGSGAADSPKSPLKTFTQHAPLTDAEIARLGEFPNFSLGFDGRSIPASVGGGISDCVRF
jgi:hypothetical protein